MTPNTIKLSILGLLSRTFGQDFDPDEETFAALVELALEYDWARKREAGNDHP